MLTQLSALKELSGSAQAGDDFDHGHLHIAHSPAQRPPRRAEVCERREEDLPLGGKSGEKLDAHTALHERGGVQLVYACRQRLLS